MPSPPARPTTAFASLRLLVWSVTTIGLAVAASAACSLATAPPTVADGLAALLFLGLAVVADLKPVPLDEHGDRTVSLAFVFILACGILFGWPSAVLVAMLAAAVAQSVERKPLPRLLFNASVYAVSAGAAALPAFVLGPRPTETLWITTHAFLGGAIYVSCNVVLVCCAIACSRGVALGPVLRDNFRHSGAAFLTMAFLAALAVRLWTIDPVGVVLLAGPLFTLALYQRSALASRVATRTALTDSLTTLGNHRSFELALASLLDTAEGPPEAVSLCLVDVDDFKGINDGFGHPVGDSVLVQLASIFRSEDTVSAYRLGGDEFALIVRGGPGSARVCASRLFDRIAHAAFVHGQPVTISVGIGSFPEHATGADDLKRVADAALYWAKHHGKDRVCVYSPSAVQVYPPEGVARVAEQRARLRAAENLIKVVDAKDTYTGAHSEAVAGLAERVGVELGLDEDTVHRLRLAGLLHDLGKIAVPDGILQKPGALTDAERALIRAHPELGASLLDGLDLGLIDVWVRHHHEHWDGSGYPEGLAGDSIPLGSRIILVADAFEAITTDRSYRRAAGVGEALDELRLMAGRQFDPTVVEALAAVLVDLGLHDNVIPFTAAA